MTAGPPLQPQRVVLIGFMGSGKTTVGRLLAARLQWSFSDLDDEVAKRQGLSVPEIFAQYGEPAFRAAEAEALADLLRRRSVVIALGGGAPATPAVEQLLADLRQTAVVHLHADFEVVKERCLRQASDPRATGRPLLRDIVAAQSRYRERAPIYAALAHHTVDVSAASPGVIAEAIHSALPTLPDL